MTEPWHFQSSSFNLTEENWAISVVSIQFAYLELANPQKALANGIAIAQSLWGYNCPLTSNANFFVSLLF